jgi:two-component system, NtrC family, response regulator
MRERKKNIAVLAGHFVEVFAVKMGKRRPTMDREFVQLLERQVWRGNIRELRNVIERALILSDGPELGVESLPVEFRSDVKEVVMFSAFDLASVEKLHILRVMNYTNGNKVEAAKLSNIGLTTVYRKIEEYGLG